MIVRRLMSQCYGRPWQSGLSSCTFCRSGRTLDNFPDRRRAEIQRVRNFYTFFFYRRLFLLFVDWFPVNERDWLVDAVEPRFFDDLHLPLRRFNRFCDVEQVFEDHVCLKQSLAA